MPVEAAELFIPRGDQMDQAFSLVIARHQEIGTKPEDILSQPFERLGRAVADYFTAGVAYLANRGHDKFIQELGTVAWWSINQKQALPILTDNMVAAAIQLGVPPHIALTQYVRNDEPYVLFTGRRRGKEIYETAAVLLPPHFIITAQNRPIDALATTTWICSNVRDLANGRLVVDQSNFEARAQASEAQFLLEAQRRYSDLDLSRDSQIVLKHYPNGLESLPPQTRYKGISGTEFRNASNN